jgi:hypothetical protein
MFLKLLEIRLHQIQAIKTAASEQAAKFQLNKERQGRSELTVVVASDRLRMGRLLLVPMHARGWREAPNVHDVAATIAISFL